MKYTELENFIKNGGSGIYLLQGEDAYFLTGAEKLIKGAYLELPDLNFSSFDGALLKGREIKKLTDALSIFPLMSEKRVIKVTDFFPTESEYENYLKPFFSAFPPTSVLIIVNSKPKKGAADLKRAPYIAYVDCGKADEDEIARWIYLTLRRAGVNVQAGLCKSIAAWCLCDMSRVAIETEKIIVYKNGKGELTAEEVAELVHKDADYRIYEMTNALAAKKYSEFMTIASDLMGKGMDEISVLNSLFSYLRNILTAASLKKRDAELAKILGMKEYGVKRSREQAKSLGHERIRVLCRQIYAAISGIKSGELTQESAFKQVCCRIFFEA